jgi:adenosylmethionine-8-amino-7-oxononanoate aminotransferase
MTELTVEELQRLDHEHVIHPLHNPGQTAAGPLVLVSGRGSLVRDADGREYIDGLSQLWNVNIGHGRGELAEAAADQMTRLAFASNYNGQANLPAIELAGRIVELAYPNMRSVYFTSGGAESNESAFKLARSYWKLQGRPTKTKVFSRRWAYHGVTIAAMSATGMASYHKQFEPLAPDFLQLEPPYWYRWEGSGTPEDCGAWAADQLEQAILREGPETVAAFIAEPVQGAGGVIPAPDGYFERIRQVCDRHDVLFIADEVITGYGRLGTWFGLERWGVEPDIVSFAKGVTSGYVPLGGIILGERVDAALRELPQGVAWMHAYTYSGHPTACAVGIANLRVIEREGLVERAALLGERLLRGLRTLASLPCVGDVRGLGLMAAIEVVADRATRRSFPEADGIGAKVLAAARQRGVMIRNRQDVLEMAPPFVTTEEQIDRIVEVVGESLREVVPAAV